MERIERKRNNTIEIGEPPRPNYFNEEIEGFIAQLDRAGIGLEPAIERMTMKQIDNLLNGPVN